ncbi:MAG: hypothetical protein V3V00_15740 [Saprospiraceae bacterium]
MYKIGAKVIVVNSRVPHIPDGSKAEIINVNDRGGNTFISDDYRYEIKVKYNGKYGTGYYYSSDLKLVE